jgi:hypothetical protein
MAQMLGNQAETVFGEVRLRQVDACRAHAQTIDMLSLCRGGLGGLFSVWLSGWLSWLDGWLGDWHGDWHGDWLDGWLGDWLSWLSVTSGAAALGLRCRESLELRVSLLILATDFALQL